MEKITKEQFEKAQGKLGRAFSPFRRALEDVLIEEGLLITRDEWQALGYKTNPNALVGQTFREPRSTKKFKVKTLSGEQGWVFLRIK